MSLEALGKSLLRSREFRNRKNVQYFTRKYLDRVVHAQLNAVLILDRRYNVVDDEDRLAINHTMDYIQNFVGRLEWDAPPRDEVREELAIIQNMLKGIAEGDRVVRGEIEDDTDQISNLATFRIQRCIKFIEQCMIGNRLFTIDLKKDLYGGHSSATRKRRR